MSTDFTFVIASIIFQNLLSRSFPNLKIPIVKRKCEKNGQKLHPFDVKIRAIKLTDAIRNGNPTQINTTTKNVFRMF